KRRGPKPLPEPALPECQQRDPNIKSHKEDELNPHPRECVSVTVVLDVFPRGDLLLSRIVRHRQAAGYRTLPRLALAFSLFVQLVHAAKQMAQSLPLFR